MELEGRKELFRTLVGSYNYNLNTLESDKDYKVFVAPTFDDLYFNKQFGKAYTKATTDFDVHDIRKVSHLWTKANVNFVEILFSDDIIINKEHIYLETQRLLDEIFQMKNDIAKMNLPYLYDSSMGMYVSKRTSLKKGTSGTQHLVEKYGYDTKQAMTTIRILDFVKRFADNNFTDFKQAIWYDNKEKNRQLLLDIRNGKFTEKEYYKKADNMFNSIKDNYEEKYKSFKEEVETNNTLINITKEIVKVQMVK